MKANNIVNVNNVRVTLTLDARKRLTALVQLLVTVDKRTQHVTKVAVTTTVKRKVVTMPARDKAGRFVSHSPPNRSSRRLSGSSDSASYGGLRAKALEGEQRLSKARKKCGPYLFRALFH